MILITIPGFAAIDLKVQGSIYSEFSSRPNNLFCAGSRVKMFSELTRTGNYPVKVRVWGLNQKAGQLNRFDASSRLNLDNIVDWVEVRFSGNLLPNGFKATLAVGNVEVDYSPYVISLIDDALSDYVSNYLHHRGLSLSDLTIGGFSISSFILWGFNDPLKNAIGGQFTRQFGSTKLKGSIVDYRWRVDGVENKVIQTLQSNAHLDSELAWQQVQSIEVGQQLGQLGQFSCFIAKQDENNFLRENDEVVQKKVFSILRDYQWSLPLEKNWVLNLGYREIPRGYDPYFRDRTPEFDPTTGHYLGFNLIDKYKGNKTLYATVTGEKEHLAYEMSLQQLTNLIDPSANSQVMEVALKGKVGVWDFDTFSFFKNQKQQLNTGINKSKLEDFNRIILAKPLDFNSFSITPGFEWRQQFLSENAGKTGTVFLRYQKGELLTAEAGVRHAFSEGTTSGAYLGLIYCIPNGLVFNYRRSTKKQVEDGKEHYDPDYRLIEPDNLVKLSIKIDF
mgnify:FL=1